MASYPKSRFYTNSVTATTDDPFCIEYNPNLWLASCNIQCFTNDAYFGNAVSTAGQIKANATVWFDNPIRVCDLLFRNFSAGLNTTIVLQGPVLEAT